MSVSPGVVDVPAAAALAEELLSEVGTRLAHTRRVAAQAARASCVLDQQPWAAGLATAGWLHDIGYSPKIRSTGFHPLDGARHLRSLGWPIEVCRLVAWHTTAGAEASLRGLGPALLDEFEPPPHDAWAALAWADLTSSPTGECWAVEDRVADVLRRYPPDSVVHEAMTASKAEVLAAAAAVSGRLDRRQQI